jgi:hypothetical protein
MLVDIWQLVVDTLHHIHARGCSMLAARRTVITPVVLDTAGYANRYGWVRAGYRRVCKSIPGGIELGVVRYRSRSSAKRFEAFRRAAMNEKGALGAALRAR